MNVGRIIRVVGPVIDVEFPADAMPAIYNALTIDGTTEMGAIHLVLEVEQHLEGGVVRAVAMDSTDGVTRGMEVVDTGAPMQMPVGPETLGHIWNVVGQEHRRRRRSRSSRRIRSTARLRRTTSSSRRPRSSRPASRSSTCSSPTSRAARRACSAAPASARRSSSWSSSTTSPWRTVVPPCSPAWASAPVRAPTSGSR